MSRRRRLAPSARDDFLPRPGRTPFGLAAALLTAPTGQAADRQFHESFVDGLESTRAPATPASSSRRCRGKLLYRSKSESGLRSLLTLAHEQHKGPQTEDVRRPFGDQESSYPPMPAFAPQVSSGVRDLELPLSDCVAFENRVVYGDIHVERRALQRQRRQRRSGVDSQPARQPHCPAGARARLRPQPLRQRPADPPERRPERRRPGGRPTPPRCRGRAAWRGIQAWF